MQDRRLTQLGDVGTIRAFDITPDGKLHYRLIEKIGEGGMGVV